MRRLGIVAALGFAGLLVFALFRARGPEPSPAIAREGPVPVVGQAPSPPDSRAGVAGPGREALPPSLRGTSPSGSLEVDAQGHFVATREAVLLFEYFLSASHEESLSLLVPRIRREIRARLAPPAAGEAEAFLDRYLEYRDQGAAEFRDASLVEGADLEQRLQWLREFRRAHFGAEVADRLFREEEDAVAVRLAMRRVADDASLDDAERLRRIEALEQQVPEPRRAARERASLPVRHARQERALRETGAGADEIHDLRVANFGPEAAERMRALDAERAAWAERMAAYRRERDVLRAEGSVEEGDLALEALRAAHFAPEERERVRLLDLVELQQESPAAARR